MCKKKATSNYSQGHTWGGSCYSLSWLKKRGTLTLTCYETWPWSCYCVLKTSTQFQETALYQNTFASIISLHRWKQHTKDHSVENPSRRFFYLLQPQLHIAPFSWLRKDHAWTTHPQNKLFYKALLGPVLLFFSTCIVFPTIAMQMTNRYHSNSSHLCVRWEKGGGGAKLGWQGI